jgi:hypothetical protein
MNDFSDRVFGLFATFVYETHMDQWPGVMRHPNGINYDRT